LKIINQEGIYMSSEVIEVKHFKVGTMKVEIHPSRKAAGAAAARATAEALKERGLVGDSIGVIFATGASQVDTLDALTGIDNLPWRKVCGFHLDEYVGISTDHPASFRRYLREKLTQKVKLKEFAEIDGNAPDLGQVCQDYAEKLSAADPQLCLLGIGENGHLAFNDPPVADFSDPLNVKIVQLDPVCRQQQAAEGWFDRFQDVPERAITLTIPMIFRVPKLIVSVPGSRKAKIIRRTLEESIATTCPSSILRTHPDATIYLDIDSADELDGDEFFN
jgi:glucosamine-6-phosphate deaminase